MRQLWDWKVSADVETMTPADLVVYSQMCGRTLAHAHARSGDRIAISSYLDQGKTFERALQQFASGYADQNERDYRALVAAVDDGRVAAERGV